MKRYNSILLTLVGALFLTGCTDELDSDKYFEDRPSLQSVFTDRNQTMGWLAQSYSFLKGPLEDMGTKRTGEADAYAQCFGDDMYFGDRDPKFGDSDDGGHPVNYNSFMLGDYTENAGRDAWINAYKGIYQASVFIHNIYRNEKMTEEERTDLKGQARFVRAYYYWLLLRKYGPVPIMPDEGADYTQSYTQLATPRATYEQCAEFIASEMKQAAFEMKNWNRFQQPNNTDAEFVAQATKGAALAVRAMAYIYAASPLANGQLQNGAHPGSVTDNIARDFTNFDGTPLLSRDYDESKWARAAAACRDVIECQANYELYHYGRVETASTDIPQTITPYDDGDFSEQNWPDGYKDIDPYLSYRRLFNGEASLTDNTEIIFSRGYNTTDDIKQMVAHQMPSECNGYNCHGLTQKMVDAYYMKDGTDCPGKDSEYGEGDGSARLTGWTTNRNYSNYKPLYREVSLQYANREPRFYASVAYNGARWRRKDPALNNNTALQTPQIFYYRDDTKNGYTNDSRHLRTGIGCMKFVHYDDYLAELGAIGNIKPKYEPAIRYADILLMYAEALNELSGSYTIESWDGQTTYSVSRDIEQIKRGIRPVRIRAGVPDYSSEAYSDPNVLRNKIKRERMIEFLGEGKRYFDLRRWMDAQVELTKPIYGCNIMMTKEERDRFQEVVMVTSLPTVFSDKMYFWPIYFDQLKANSLLVQSPGWKYND